LALYAVPLFSFEQLIDDFDYVKKSSVASSIKQQQTSKVLSLSVTKNHKRKENNCFAFDGAASSFNEKNWLSKTSQFFIQFTNLKQFTTTQHARYELTFLVSSQTAAMLSRPDCK
jgi:hypothetical protein